MGNLALIFEAANPAFSLHPMTAARLSGLGVTRVSVLGDEESIAVVLEGWAFDPERSRADAETALFGGTGCTRVLHELAQLTLSER